VSYRIAQLCADRGIAPGGTKGASLHLRGIASALGALGHDVVTFSARRPEGEFPNEVRPLDEFDTCDGTDVVYERYSLGHLGGLEWARERGVRFILEVNAPLVDEAQLHRPDTVDVGDREAEERLLREADLVIVVSTALERWVSTHRAGPTLMLANGFEPAWFEGPAPEAEFDLGFIGHPKPWHGADRIPQLLVALHEQDLAANAIVIGGGDGAEALLNDAQRLGVADHLVVTGPLAPAEAAGRLRTARIGLAPYRSIEPFYFCPLKVVDYLAARLAVVASDIGDIATLTGPAGTLVDPDSDEQLLGAVASLLNDTAELDRLATLGHRIGSRLTWASVAQRTIEAIDMLPRIHPARHTARPQ